MIYIYIISTKIEFTIKMINMKKIGNCPAVQVEYESCH